MRDKLARGEYQSVDDVRQDFERIIDNATLYHSPGIVFHDWALAMKEVGMEILSRATCKKISTKTKV